MKSEILKQLDHTNREFYQKYANSFSLTRRKLQSGVNKNLKNLPRNGNWLDVGCGNGNLAHAWIKNGFQGFLCGIDFSAGLIIEAEKLTADTSHGQKVVFRQADLTRQDWAADLPEVSWDGIFCFAVLHHIPGRDRRTNLCAQFRKLLPAGKTCIVSVWQPRNSARLEKRIQPWESVGISFNDVDAGDVLMDWRAHQTLKHDEKALRYVHIFSIDELSQLANANNFTVKETYFSDGREGNLGLYQKWTANF